MRNRNRNSLQIRHILILALIAGIFGACSKMDDTFKDFIKDGKIPYTGKAESISVHPGRNRMVLRWPTPSDPKAIKAKIYWNNRLDSVEVPINRESNITEVTFNDWEEGSYVFEIFTYDAKGTSSLGVELMARVYGDQYESRLLSQPLDQSEFADGRVEFTWGAAPDTTVHGSEIQYEDIDGISHTLFVPGSETLTVVENFKPQTIRYRTLYKPSPLALDIFYTPYFTHRVYGPPRRFSKEGWTATASSNDVNGNRPVSHTIDNNPNTIWVNRTSNPKEVYPHTMTVDMGVVHNEIEGFAIITRVGDPAARPKTVDLLTSLDGENWTMHGQFVLANTGDEQLIAIPESTSARYFRIIARDAHNGGDNIALAEAGLYTR